MGRAFIPNKIFSCSLILETSVHEKTWQIGPTVLPLKLDEGGVLISSRCVADLERWKVDSRHRHTPDIPLTHRRRQSILLQQNKSFLAHIKTRASGALMPVPFYGDVTSRVKKKFEEIMEANIWLSDLLLDRVANKTVHLAHFLSATDASTLGSKQVNSSVRQI